MIYRNILKFLFAASAICAAANAATFNFDADNLSTATQFTDTVNGASATFSSPADPGGFVVYTSIFQTLTGNVLGDPGPAQADNLALSISFNTMFNAIKLNFATSDFTVASPLTLTAYNNSTVVGTATATGNFLTGFTFPEGEIAFSGNGFNRVLVSSTAADFAVDNISVATPEPATIALFACGLLVIGIVPLKRKRGRKPRIN